jgi:hypothetical protein
MGHERRFRDIRDESGTSDFGKIAAAQRTDVKGRNRHRIISFFASNGLATSRVSTWTLGRSDDSQRHFAGNPALRPQ